MIKKITFITNYPVSYRIDFFNSLFDSEDIDFNFIFISSKRDRALKRKISEYDTERFLSKSVFLEGNYLSLFHKLKFNKSDIIIIGGFPVYYIIVVVFKILYRSKLICWWGGTNLINGSRGKLETIYRKIMSSFLDGGVYYSDLAKDNMKSLNSALSYEYVLGNNTRNSKSFYEKVIAIKKPFVVYDKIYVLTVGALKKHKNTMLVLKAINSDVFLKKNVELLVIGEGEELKTLKLYSSQNKINVQFLGHVPVKDMFQYFEKASVFVHPSNYDQWPQVYNEAISSGLPTLVSNRSEVYDEYTKKYYDKVVFESSDYSELCLKLSEVIRNFSLRNELSEFALKTALENNGVAKINSFNEFLLSIK